MFDTLLYAKRLEAAGMSREQAETQVHVIAEMVVDGVATKQDIALLKQDMVLLRQDLALQKAETAKDFISVRSEIALLRSEMIHGFAEVRSDLKMDILTSTNRNLKIMGAMMITSTTLTIAVLGMILK